MKMSFDEVKRGLHETLRRFDEQMTKFKHNLDFNPVHAFTWSETIMALSARRRIAQHYLQSIATWEAARKEGTLADAQPQTEEAVVEFLARSALREALNKARYVKRSTSCTSNFIEAEESACFAELAAEWNGIH